MTPTIFGDDFQLAPPRTNIGIPPTPSDDWGRPVHETPAGEGPRWAEGSLASALVQRLRETDTGWVVIPQVWAPDTTPGGRGVIRKIDLLAIKLPELHAVAIEIKTRRQDFVADVENPDKQAPWRGLFAHFYAAPAGVIEPLGVPSGSGLLEVGPSGRATVTIPAPQGRREMPDWLMRAVLGRASSVISFHEGWLDQLGDLPNTAVLLERAQSTVARQERALQRARETAEAWRMLAAAQGHKVPCRDCGAAVVPTRISAGVPGGWRHAQPHLTLDCPGNRTGVRPREIAPPEEGAHPAR